MYIPDVLLQAGEQIGPATPVDEIRLPIHICLRSQVFCTYSGKALSHYYRDDLWGHIMIPVKNYSYNEKILFTRTEQASRGYASRTFKTFECSSSGKWGWKYATVSFRAFEYNRCMHDTYTWGFFNRSLISIRTSTTCIFIALLLHHLQFNIDFLRS